MAFIFTVGLVLCCARIVSGVHWPSDVLFGGTSMALAVFGMLAHTPVVAHSTVWLQWLLARVIPV